GGGPRAGGVRAGRAGPRTPVPSVVTTLTGAWALLAVARPAPSSPPSVPAGAGWPDAGRLRAGPSPPHDVASTPPWTPTRRVGRPLAAAGGRSSTGQPPPAPARRSRAPRGSRGGGAGGEARG